MNLKTTELPDRRLWCVSMTEQEATKLYIDCLIYALETKARPPEILTQLCQLLVGTHQAIGPSEHSKDLREGEGMLKSDQAKLIIALAAETKWREK